MPMTRFFRGKLTVAVTASAATTGIIDVRDVSCGEVYIPAASALTSLTWYAAPTPGDTFVAAQDGAGVAITSTVSSSKCVPIPTSLVGCGALKAVGNDAGTIYVSLKG